MKQGNGTISMGTWEHIKLGEIPQNRHRNQKGVVLQASLSFTKSQIGTKLFGLCVMRIQKP
jgi:hypothetical protein